MNLLVRPYFQHDCGEDANGNTIIGACYMCAPNTESKVRIELNAVDLVALHKILTAALARRTCHHCGHIGPGKSTVET